MFDERIVEIFVRRDHKSEEKVVDCRWLGEERTYAGWF
jgi:hypothetical protein